MLDNELYAQPVSTIREVFPYREPIPVPDSKNYVEGILNIRGDVVAIISGRQLMNLNKQDASIQENGRIMILEPEWGQFGIIVDSVEDIVTINSSLIDTTPNGSDLELIKGTYTHSTTGLIIVTDLTNITVE